MGRKEAREVALHLIFELGFKQFETDEVLPSRLEQAEFNAIAEELDLYGNMFDAAHKDYICSVVAGVGSHLAELDEVIATHTQNWNANRISRMTTAILRLAIYEMRYVEDVPEGAAINEAVELAKKYDTEQASSFINGVLGGIVRGQAEVPEETAE